MRKLLRFTLALCLLPWLYLTGDTFARDLTFEDRIKAQEAIERVYYSHQIGATKPFEQAVPRGVLEGKVRTYLRQSVALEKFWNAPVTGEALRTEMERIVANTRFPGRLREVYQALGGDAFIFQECYVRPFLVDRLSRSFFSSDERIHAARKMKAEELHERLLNGTISVLDEHPYRNLIEVAVVEGKATDGEEPNQHVPSEIRRMEMDPDEYRRWRAHSPPEVGVIGAVSEERDAFLIRVIIAEEPRGARAAVYVIRKLTWDDWWASSQDQFDEMLAVGGATGLSETNPSLTRSSLQGSAYARAVAPCGSPDDVWQNGILDDVPDGRVSPAVWTGSVMILWGGRDDRLISRDGWRYDPLSDTWTPITTNGAPDARYAHAAVWTGTLMVVWGGYDGSHYLSTGGRYDPATDTWTPTTTTNAPLARPVAGTAVWTGRYMVLWGGGYDSLYLNTGGRYDPVNDTWTATSMINAPAPRRGHSAIWTGSSVIIWGGVNLTSFLNSGGRYDPSTDTWTPTSTIGAPSARYGHSAVWTGSLMLVWGGYGGFATGGRYDPAGNTWTPISTLAAPPERYNHSAVWTGSLMIVWGGLFLGPSYLNSGGRYDPISNTWSPTSTTNAPAARVNHSYVWTGSLMIVWGGSQENLLYLNTGGRYDPISDTWTPTSTGTGPEPRRNHSAVWTGSLMIVWGGYPGAAPFKLDTGGRYDPVSDSWSPTSMTGAPEARYDHTAVWTGSVMVVWGGFYLNTGGRYDPISDTWEPTSTTGAPAGRRFHSAVWTGSLMIVWGGDGGMWLSSGGRYDPVADTWTPTSEVNAPEARYYHTAVWTGRLMVVWGGRGGIYLGTGGRYDPVEDTWTPTSMVNALSRRILHTAIWTGSRMIVWGGEEITSGGGLTSTGAQYDPRQDIWVSTSAINAPTGRLLHAVVWTGSLMVVWGGWAGPVIGDLSTGGRYDPVSDTWTPTSTVDSPVGRSGPAAVWTGSHMIVWGGGNARASGGRYAVTDSSDRDMDGFRFCDGDCDDSNNHIHPGATETCDGVDENCDGVIDDGFDLGESCQVRVDECHEVTGVWVCRPDGTSNQCEGSARFHDTTPPIITCPREVTAECPAQPILGSAIVTDACDPNSMVVNDAPDIIRLGSILVTWTATDSSGNASTCQQTITSVDTTPPSLSCPTSTTTECTSPAGASISLLATASDACSPTAQTQNDHTPNGADGSGVYPLGATSVVFEATDASGNIATCQAQVKVQDTTPPTLALGADPQTLWPPNHRMVQVQATWQMSDVCDPAAAVVLASATSSEPDDSSGSGDGNTTQDIQDASLGSPDQTVLLRAERSGDGPGRIYTLTYVARDASGNTASSLGIVTVPIDEGTGPEPVLLNVEGDGPLGMVHLYWNAVSGADLYDLIQGDLSQVAESNGVIRLGSVHVLASGQIGTSYSEVSSGAVPTVGHAYFYLVQYREGQTASGWGTESSLWPAEPTSCDIGCPGESITASVGSITVHRK